jgi:hypothetical protein
LRVTFLGNIKTELRTVAKHCAYCGDSLKQVTIDHVRPKSKHGVSHISNYAAACNHCNATLKRDLTVDEFFRRNPQARTHFINYLIELRGKVIGGINYSEVLSRFVRNGG